jgi:hypothetical protein
VIGPTPSFTAFANPDYFTDAGPSCGSNPCIDYHCIEPRRHQDVIGTPGLARSPGVAQGVDSSTWTDH